MSDRPPPLELSRYCIPWSPFTGDLARARVSLVTTAGVHHRSDPPFVTAGDNSWRRIPGDAAASDLAYSDEHYPHDCVDRDLNCVFPVDRLAELGRAGVIAGPAAAHFAMGFTQQLAAIRATTVPELAREVDRVRPDAVILTGG